MYSADRLPEYAVRSDSRRWWEEWQYSVRKAAHSRDVPALVNLTATFGEQINVSDIEGKVDVTTTGWKAQVRISVLHQYIFGLCFNDRIYAKFCHRTTKPCGWAVLNSTSVGVLKFGSE